MPSPDYYYRSGKLYGVGDCAMPGNWGQVIFGHGPSHNHFYREYVFEATRRGEFPKAPSRLTSVFVFESRAFAEQWVRKAGEREYLYRVGLRLTDMPKIHRADMRWLDELKNCRSFEAVGKCAISYWKGIPLNNQDPQWEILVPGPIAVCEMLEDIRVSL